MLAISAMGMRASRKEFKNNSMANALNFLALIANAQQRRNPSNLQTPGALH